MDNGFPLVTEPNMLTAMIAPPSMLGRMKKVLGGRSSSVAQVLPRGTLSQVPWRKAGVRHKFNQIFFDIFEDVDCVVNERGRVVSCDVAGTIACDCHLSGMPDLTMSFCNPEVIRDCSFHPCVRYRRYERNNVVSFVPPDGEFQLMRYRVPLDETKGFDPPVRCRVMMNYDEEHSNAQIQISLRLRPSNSVRSSRSGTIPRARDLAVCVSLSSQTRALSNLVTSTGKAAFDSKTKTLRWKLPSEMKDRSTPTLTARVDLEGRRPRAVGDAASELLAVRLRFNIPNASISGLRVDALNLTNEPYKPYKGVRAMVRAGAFQVRASCSRN